MSHRNDCRIYVGNLPPDISTKDIKHLFYKFGKISFIDLKNRRGPPFAFVEFEHSRDAKDALHSRNGYEYDGYKLRVEFPKSKDQRNGSSLPPRGDRSPQSGRISRLFTTLYYASNELIYQLIQLTKWVLCHTRTCSAVLVLCLALAGVSYMDGPHQQFLTLFRKQMVWCLYWCGLGILSSVGLGTGLHTFLLYLGPHIASVTLAAYECDSLDFPSPPYPDELICPVETTAQSLVSSVNVWSIMSKVRLEAFMWGAGTALGELPPYFVARAHRLSGEEEEELDPELAEEIVATSSGSGAPVPKVRQKSLVQRFRTSMIRLVTKVGFFGILGCASIPNPLFDLAGITCGYSLVPFWTFFGATLIGKAIIKMHIQKLFVIVAFNENYVELFVHKSRNIPYVGQYLHEPLREFLVKQKKNLHRGSAEQAVKESSWLSTIFEWVVISMIVYFLVSIISSMADNYQKRQRKHSTASDSDLNHLKTK